MRIIMPHRSFWEEAIMTAMANKEDMIYPLVRGAVIRRKDLDELYFLEILHYDNIRANKT